MIVDNLSPLPGEQLKVLREQRGLSFDDVQKVTMIHPERLRLLESDAYDALGGSVFIVGYIRRYAKSVDADADALVDRFKQHLQQSASVQSDDIINLAVANERSLPSPLSTVLGKAFSYIHSPLTWSFLGVCVLLTVVFIFHNSRSHKRATVTDQVANTVVQKEYADQGTINSNSLPQKKDQQQKVAIESRVRIDSAVAQSDKLKVKDEQMPKLSDVAPSVLDNADVTASQISVVTQQARADINTSDVLADAADSATNIGAVSTPNDSLLEFMFDDTCWVEIRDKENTVLFAANRNPGENLSITGQAPFEVMLGNASAVSLTVDGERVDTSVRGSRRTLRLAIPAPIL